ncbi:phosphatase PAP2 family protein [Sphingobacterium sp. SGG-5]|uniref:phosphatase PAP2 family protein n=1 Tax=Sphingobacterium sp. SGG-5 TaxID=2710881 RepID=UPI0013EACB07|nr:phosphatase PAP2 family protein [Sphingobacterium sp. SGG-5]NGM62260.1 phosphatase PAP2 family protein [Sphingobacterium sp. SGG-5]
MWQEIVNIDKEIFLWINQGLSSSFLDGLLPILRNPYTWAPLYLFLIIFFIKHYGKMGIIIVLCTLVNFGISDAVSSHVIKKSVERLRPCNDPEFKEHITLRVRCGSGYSFTSSHATNHFAMAFFWIVLFRRKWRHALWLCILWATAIGISQIYVGVHYPFDILCGAVLGIIIGLLSGWIFKRSVPQFFTTQTNSETNPV